MSDFLGFFSLTFFVTGLVLEEHKRVVVIGWTCGSRGPRARGLFGSVPQFAIPQVWQPYKWLEEVL